MLPQRGDNCYVFYFLSDDYLNAVNLFGLWPNCLPIVSCRRSRCQLPNVWMYISVYVCVCGVFGKTIPDFDSVYEFEFEFDNDTELGSGRAVRSEDAHA